MTSRQTDVLTILARLSVTESRTVFEIAESIDTHAVGRVREFLRALEIEGFVEVVNPDVEGPIAFQYRMMLELRDTTMHRRIAERPLTNYANSGPRNSRTQQGGGQ